MYDDFFVATTQATALEKPTTAPRSRFLHRIVPPPKHKFNPEPIDPSSFQIITWG